MQERYDLFLKVIGKFQAHEILDKTILIGSWCMLYYADLFKESAYRPTIRTRDIDFLVPLPLKIKKKTDELPYCPACWAQTVSL